MPRFSPQNSGHLLIASERLSSVSDLCVESGVSSACESISRLIKEVCIEVKALDPLLEFINKALSELRNTRRGTIYVQKGRTNG